MREPKVRVMNGLRVRLPGDARRRAAAVATVDRRMDLLEARRAAPSPPATAAVPPPTGGWTVRPDWIIKPEGAHPHESVPSELVFSSQESAIKAAMRLAAHAEATPGSNPLIPSRHPSRAGQRLESFVFLFDPKLEPALRLDEPVAVYSHVIDDDDRVVFISVGRHAGGADEESRIVARVMQELMSRSRGRASRP